MAFWGLKTYIGVHLLFLEPHLKPNLEKEISWNAGLTEEICVNGHELCRFCEQFKVILFIGYIQRLG